MDYNRRNTYKRPRSRSRSRSRSPPRSSSYQEKPKRNDRAMEERERLDTERRKRMAKLRAENEAEEKKMAAVDQAAKMRGEGGEYYHNQPVSISAINNKNHPSKQTIINVDEEELKGLDEEEQMQKLFGFGNFGSTKGKAVEDNQNSAARGVAAKNKARKYRQYMNRKGGFNRPLDKMN